MIVSDYPIIFFLTAILIAFMANSSGFSGAVYFQPFFYFFTDLPLKETISTGIATETVGMSSGAFTYWRRKKINLKILKDKLSWIVAGIILGFIMLKFIPRPYLRSLVGISMILAGGFKLWSLKSKNKYQGHMPGAVSLIAGAFSTTTGTGNAEIHQPLLEHRQGLNTLEANATAIGLEAIGNIIITSTNLVISDLRFDILKYTIPGVIIGSQLGVWYGLKAPGTKQLVLFSFSVIWIGLVYLFT